MARRPRRSNLLAARGARVRTRPTTASSRPPPPYGYQQYGAVRCHAPSTPRARRSSCSASSAWSICSILGPFAWSMGNKAIREIDSDPTPDVYANRGQIVAGRICGMIATILIGVSLVIIVIAVIAAAGSSN